MKAITVPTAVAVGDPATAAQANSYRTAVSNLSSREGAKATTAATQAISATTLTTLTGGASAWTATEDTGSYVSATVGTTTPITIPAGKQGLYSIGVHYVQAATSAGRNFVDVRVNGVAVQRFNYSNDSQGDGAVPYPLNAGDTLGAEVFSTNAATASIGCTVFCYRLGD